MYKRQDTLREKGVRRVGPYMVTKAMASGVSACLATGAKIKGINYGISSACSTSAHCIGAGAVSYTHLDVYKRQVLHFLHVYHFEAWLLPSLTVSS